MAWHFKTDNLGPRPEFQYEGTPLMANGIIYSTGGTRRAVFALDAATGELLMLLFVSFVIGFGESPAGTSPEDFSPALLHAA